MLKNNNFVNKLKFNLTQNTITKNRKYIMNIYTQRQTVYKKTKLEFKNEPHI